MEKVRKPQEKLANEIDISIISPFWSPKESTSIYLRWVNRLGTWLRDFDWPPQTNSINSRKLLVLLTLVERLKLQNYKFRREKDKLLVDVLWTWLCVCDSLFFIYCYTHTQALTTSTTPSSGILWFLYRVFFFLRLFVFFSLFLFFFFSRYRFVVRFDRLLFTFVFSSLIVLLFSCSIFVVYKNINNNFINYNVILFDIFYINIYEEIFLILYSFF